MQHILASAFFSRASFISRCTFTPLPSSQSTPDVVFGKKCVLLYTFLLSACVPPCLWSAAPSPLSSEAPAKLSSPSLGPIRYHSLVLSSVTAPQDAGRHYNSLLCPQLLSLSLTHGRNSSIF